MKLLVNNIYKNLGDLDRLFPYFQLLPNILLKHIAKFFSKRLKYEMEATRFPHHLVFFITNKCNQKCAHCFYAKELNNNKDELTIEQIRNMARSLSGKVTQVVLSGGEPFLRGDIVDICIAFNDLAGVKSITIMTNGFLPKKIERAVTEILDKTSLKLNFQVSIDGPEFIHDKNRGREGAFKKALETIEKLQQIQHKEGRIHRIVTATPIGKHNYDHIHDTIHEFKKMNNILHGFGFVRGTLNDTKGILDKSLLNDFNPEGKIYLSVNEMKEAIKTIDVLLWSKVKRHLYYALSKEVLKTIVEFKTEGFNGFLCMAGISDFIIYPNGDIGLCEMLKPFGNIRKYGFDVVEFWDQEYEQFKRKTKGCKCTHSCVISAYIKFDEIRLFNVFKRDA